MIGAIYLDKGYRVTQRFIINRILNTHVDISRLAETESNYKSRLLEWAQKEGKEVVFEVIEDKSLGQSRLFSVRAMVDGIDTGLGQDYSKKNAEKNAAEKSCQYLNI